MSYPRQDPYPEYDRPPPSPPSQPYGRPPQSHPQPSHPQPSYPQPNQPQPNYPPQGHPQPSYPPSGHPQPARPSQGYPQQQPYPPQARPPQVRTPQSYPPQSYPPPGRVPQRGYPSDPRDDERYGYDDRSYRHDTSRGYGGYPQSSVFDEPYGYHRPRSFETSGTYRAPAEPEPKGRNGFAVTALICGMLASPCFSGIIFGILGLVRAGKVGTGRAMSWLGIMFSIAWLVAATVFVLPRFTSQVHDTAVRVEKQTDPGCISGESAALAFASKVDADQSDITKLKADFQDLVKQLNSAAAESHNAKAAAAMTKMAKDLQTVVDALNHRQTPSSAVMSRLQPDGDAIDTACGAN